MDSYCEQGVVGNKEGKVHRDVLDDPIRLAKYRDVYSIRDCDLIVNRSLYTLEDINSEIWNENS